MNKSTGETQPKFELPPIPEGQEALREKALEGSQDDESGVGKQSPQQAVAIQPAVPSALDNSISIPVTQIQTPATTPKTDDLPAADIDRIEKQWVERAKKIVARTRDDPYKQKSEISQAGADYIKKRFNKTIPTDDAVRT